MKIYLDDHRLKTKRPGLFKSLSHRREILRAKRSAQDDVPRELKIIQVYAQNKIAKVGIAMILNLVNIDLSLKFVVQYCFVATRLVKTA
jgi:hypothetical protein